MKSQEELLLSPQWLESTQEVLVYHVMAELQTRGYIKDNSKIIFFISQ